MTRNPLQFAVVREDPAIDLAVLSKTPARRALLVASGGCTAFTLQQAFPDLELTLVEPNPAQRALVRRKLRLLREGDPRVRPAAWNIESHEREGLCQGGNFDGLFRQLRGFLYEFVAPQRSWRRFFEGSEESRAGSPDLEEWFRSPWWPVAFEIFFSDAVLETMFTAAATQHATPGSYPAYFQSAFERGLCRRDARDNYFLHHALLGMYIDRPAALPPYLTRALPSREVRFIETGLEEIDDFSPYDFVGLSNVMDWMPASAIAELCAVVGNTLSPGAAVLWRQLNNEDRHELRFGQRLAASEVLSDELQAADRSLFYNRIVAGFSTGDGG